MLIRKQVSKRNITQIPIVLLVYCEQHEIFPFLTIWIDMEDIKLGEISQTQNENTKYYL